MKNAAKSIEDFEREFKEMDRENVIQSLKNLEKAETDLKNCLTHGEKLQTKLINLRKKLKEKITPNVKDGRKWTPHDFMKFVS